jgi:dTDP-glucose 4,6-dehydratase
MVLDKLNKPKSLITHTEDRYGQVMKHISSTDKAFKLLGWKAKTDFEGGLTKTTKWYEENPAWWQKLLWMRHVPMKTRDGKIVYY